MCGWDSRTARVPHRLTGPARWESLAHVLKSKYLIAIRDGRISWRGAGWGAASIAPLLGDASTRFYSRLAPGRPRNAMLMDISRSMPKRPTAPVGASEEMRRGTGCIMRWRGLRAPS